MKKGRQERNRKGRYLEKGKEECKYIIGIHTGRKEGTYKKKR